jgi:flagellar basal body-associated protein FliL
MDKKQDTEDVPKDTGGISMILVFILIIIVAMVVLMFYMRSTGKKPLIVEKEINQ